MRHLHRNYSFAEPLSETVALSLQDSCRSELTRQGISLSSVASSHSTLLTPTGSVEADETFASSPPVARRLGLYLHLLLGAWRIVSGDFQRPTGLWIFPADCPHPRRFHL